MIQLNNEAISIGWAVVLRAHYILAMVEVMTYYMNAHWQMVNFLSKAFFSDTLLLLLSLKLFPLSACPDPKYDENTNVNPSQLNTNYRAVTTVSCKLGYAFQQEQIPAGETSLDIECGYKGVWKNYRQVPRCTRKFSRQLQLYHKNIKSDFYTFASYLGNF
jgi:hypothetical protein